jgi:hypothetical protein
LINNAFVQSTSISDANQSGLYLHTVDFRIHDINLLGGQLELIADYQFFKGGTYAFGNTSKNVTFNGGEPESITTVNSPSDQLPFKVGDTSGGRCGFVYFHPFGGYTPPPPSLWRRGYWEIAFFGGYGASELFGTDPLNGKGTLAGYNLNQALQRINSDGTISSGSLRRATQFRAIGQTVWNVGPCFAVSAEVHYRYDDAGALIPEVVSTNAAGVNNVRTTGGASWVFGGLIRPVYWLTDWFALQGPAGIDYVNNNRNGGQAFNPNGTLRNDAFGHSGGALGVFTFAPTIKPTHRNISTYDIEKGGFYTRPEFRIFGTYAIWAKSLEGAIGGTPYQDSREGWVFGVQTEWFF